MRNRTQRGNDYNWLATWRRRTAVPDATTGEVTESFADNGTLWVGLEEGQGRRGTDYGTPQSSCDATIRVRCFPTLSALDRLIVNGKTYIIDGIVTNFERNELVCSCNKFDDLTV